MFYIIMCTVNVVLCLHFKARWQECATFICRLRPSGNHTATFAVNHNFSEQILDWSIGESV